MWVRVPSASPKIMNMPKRSKLQAFRLYLLSQSLWHLVIRFDCNKELIQQELDRIWLDVQKVNKLPRSCPTLGIMNKIIEDSSFLEKYK